MFESIKKSLKVASATAFAFAVTASGVLASNAASNITGIQTAGESDLLQWIRNAINLAIGISALVAVIILVYSGFQYIIAAGDEGKVETATKGITYAIIGLVICFISVLIVNFAIQFIIQ